MGGNKAVYIVEDVHFICVLKRAEFRACRPSSEVGESEKYLLMMFSHRLPWDFWPVGLMRSKKVNFLYLANDSNLRAPSTSLLGVTKF